MRFSFPRRTQLSPGRDHAGAGRRPPSGALAVSVAQFPGVGTRDHPYGALGSVRRFLLEGLECNRATRPLARDALVRLLVVRLAAARRLCRPGSPLSAAFCARPPGENVLGAALTLWRRLEIIRGLFASQPTQGLASIRGERVRVVGGDVLVKLLSAGSVAELLISLAELVHRVGAALGALAEGGEAFDRQVRPAQLVEIDFPQQPARRIPAIFVGGAGEFLGPVAADFFEESDRFFLLAAAQQCPGTQKLGARTVRLDHLR